MHQEERLSYAAVDGWRMVTLPTAGEAVVDVLLADEPDAALSVDTIIALQERASRMPVDLALPRFRVEVTAKLNEPLRALDVMDAFDPHRADFSGIAADPMFIETAVHKAVVDVDEQGFEGAAATALSMRLVSLERIRPVPFHVDRPFVAVVRHAKTGAVYFLARVAEPS